MEEVPAPFINRRYNATTLAQTSTLLDVAQQPSQSAPYVPRTCSILGTEGNQLWMPDKRRGNLLLRLSTTAGDALALDGWTPVIPSARRIHSVVVADATFPSLVACDDMGNVYALQESSIMPPATKRIRTEEPTSTEEHLGVWQCVLPASAHEPTRGCLATYGSPDGWVGLCRLETSGSLACTREHYFDTRVFDAESSAILRTYRHMHSPVSSATREGSLLCAEGPLIAAYDTRSANRIAVHRSTMATSTVSHISCIPGRSNEVVTSLSDRSVVIWDVRTWGRVVTIPTVLKYATASCISVRGGAFLVCAGIDSEVRIVSTAVTTQKASKSTPTAADADASKEPAVSSFRNRISETVHCESVWHGAWAAWGDSAVGMAITGELYTAA